MRAVVIDVLHPLPRRQQGAAAVDGADEFGLGDELNLVSWLAILCWDV